MDFDVFPKEAQQKVIDHYEELGFFYDTAYQVERAWAEYNELGCPKDFRAYVARQSTATSYYNDRVIFLLHQCDPFPQYPPQLRKILQCRL